MICVTRFRSRNPKGEGERLRKEILDAAVALIDSEGPEQLSLRAVARQAGVTAPAIYAHFDDLDDVRRAVIGRAFDDFAEYLSRCASRLSDPVARLRALCRGYAAYGVQRPRHYALMFGPLAQPDPGKTATSIVDMPGGSAFAILMDAIQACVDSGASVSTQPYEDAMAVWVALHGYVGLRSGIPEIPWPADDALLDGIVDRLAGLG